VKPTAVYSPGYNGFLRNVPQTVTVLDLIHLHGSSAAKYKPYYNFFLKPLIKRNGHVMTISETSKADIENWLEDDSVEVINAGMGSTPEFTHDGDRFESERPYYLYVGNLREHKNVDTLMEAMRSIEGADLVVVSSDRAAVHEMAASHGVAGRVKSLSGVDDRELARIFRGARATVQPSTLEGFGLPALESALCGTPVVFYEGCESVREICAGGGISVSSAHKSQEWAEALESVVPGSAFPEGLVTPGQYSWNAVARSVDGVLARVANSGSAD
jgi:glycosyltransferase involved in cell wall biosynthesis